MKYLRILIFVLFLYLPLSAQYIVGINYDISVPGGELKDFISETSLLGFSSAGRVYLDKNKSVGLNIGWTRFLQASDEPLYHDGKWYYGVQQRSVYIMPFLLNFHYYVNIKKDIRLFAGVNAGFYYVIQKFKLNKEKLLDNTLHPGFAPDAGIIQTLSSGIRGIMGVRYNYVIPVRNGANFNYWNFYIGFVIQTSYF